jgi:uncharacterized protein YbjT (DUF2867 family)
VSLYLERGGYSFYSVHVEAAARVARLAGRAGVERFVHISGLGADARSVSPYIRSRGEGEAAVLQAFPPQRRWYAPPSCSGPMTRFSCRY